jgi:3'-phosphoadenosine 5'-phosphosulfate sulfotransferase (PAPS reductase)/FAD synthetase
MKTYDEIDFYLEDLKSKFTKIDFDKYMLSYSGGRDSHFLYWFIKDYMKDDKIEIVGINTGMEHKEILRRILDNSDTVLKPIMNKFEIKEKYGIPCFTKKQDEQIQRYQGGSKSKYTYDLVHQTNKTTYNLNNTASYLTATNQLHKVSNKCCLYTKKKPMKLYAKKVGKDSIIGVRADESKSRKDVYKSCFTKQGTFTPIFDLTNDMLKEIEKRYNIEIPKIYNYIDRTGCMGCPYGHNIYKELSLVTPQQQKYYYKYFKESYKVLGIDNSQQLTMDLETKEE